MRFEARCWENRPIYDSLVRGGVVSMFKTKTRLSLLSKQSAEEG